MDYLMLRRRAYARLAAWIPAAFALGLAAWAYAGAPSAAIDFTQEVRPLLAKNCLTCHGADPAKREADLRLDQLQTVGDVRGAAEVISPGKPEDSELFARIASADPDQRMPPVDSGKSLKPEEIDV